MPNDLVSVLRPSNDTGPSARVRQGTVESWDGATGNNTIKVAGGSLLNVPSLTAESAALTAGDVVALLSAGNRWFLLGKVTTPGDPGTVPTWNVDISGLTDQVTTIQTVTIPAVQNDVTIVQGDVIDLGNTKTTTYSQTTAPTGPGLVVGDVWFNTSAQNRQYRWDGTAWANVRDGNIAVAVTTAQAAQADAATAQGTANAAQAAADAAQSDVDTLTGTTLPAMQSDIDAAQAGVDTLTGTTLPALQTQVNGILPITATKITDGSITTPKLDAGAVTTAKVAAGAITTNELGAGAVTAVKIAADTITAAQIAASAITASELAANAVTAGKIAAGTIVAADISSGAITTAKIAAGAVTTNELAANAVTAAKIAAGTITATEIQAGAITGTKLAADAIDGKTITGATLQTATSGERVVIDSANQGLIQFFPSTVIAGAAPGYITSTNTYMHIEPATVPGYGDAYIDLGGDGGPGGTSVSLIYGNNVNLWAVDGTNTAEASVGWGGTQSAPVGPFGIRLTGGCLQYNSVDVATVSDAQTLTNKTISYTSNTITNFPQPAYVENGTDIVPFSNTSFSPGSPICGVGFIAPASGKVYITTTAHMENVTASRQIYCSPEIRTGTTVGAGSIIHASVTDEGVAVGGGAAFTRINASREILVTGLTAGNGYNVYTQHIVASGAGSGNMFYRSLLVKPVL